MPKQSARLQGFDCIAQADAQILILGSMPGKKSLADKQYYAHPRNCFWQIISKLFNIKATENYQQRLFLLQQQQLALWDVVHRCSRKGSLDADIDTQTVTANQFQHLFDQCPNIKSVFFNGQKAAALYRRLVLPELTSTTLLYHILPSTSPAHASLNFQQKYQQWRCIKHSLKSDVNRMML